MERLLGVRDEEEEDADLSDIPNIFVFRRKNEDSPNDLALRQEQKVNYLKLERYIDGLLNAP